MSRSEHALFLLASATFEILKDPPSFPWDRHRIDDQPLLRVSSAVTSAILALREFSEAADALKQDEELECLASIEGENDPIFLFPGGSSRQQLGLLPLALLTPAIRLAQIMNIASSSEFSRLVVENHASLKRAIRGQPVEMLGIHGLTGITLPPETSVTTPWGIVTPVPPQRVGIEHPYWAPPTTAILTRRMPVAVEISREAAPEHLEAVETWSEEKRAQMLLPLAFALGAEAGRPGAPRFTFSTTVVPFLDGFGSTERMPLGIRSDFSISAEQIAGIERWASVIEANHTPSLDIAARRLVSALSERHDPDDRLIDAVICWESLVGTSSETVNRVASALAIALEQDVEGRQQLVKKLKETYGARSKLVHGSEISAEKRLRAADHSLDIAVRALRCFYSAGTDWTSGPSEKRADRIILGEWLQSRT